MASYNINSLQDWLNLSSTTFPAGSVVNLNTDFTLTSDTNLTIMGGVTFDGHCHTVTIGGAAVAGFSGLINLQGGTIQNVNVDGQTNNVMLKNVPLYSGHGWVAQNSSRGNINKCSSSGTIPANCAGIVGGNFTGTVTNCYSTGDMNPATSGGYGCGGIIGNLSYNFIVSDCYSTGIMYWSAGGIVGGNAPFSTSGIGIVKNCYSLGVIGSYSGGIAGFADENNDFGNSTLTIQNCYALCGNKNNLSNPSNGIGDYSGGIVGSLPGNTSYASTQIIVSNCYVICSSSFGTQAGSIFGGYFYTPPYESTLVINNCYGIFPFIPSSDPNMQIITNSYNINLTPGTPVPPGWDTTIWGSSALSTPTLSWFQQQTYWLGYNYASDAPTLGCCTTCPTVETCEKQYVDHQISDTLEITNELAFRNPKSRSNASVILTSYETRTTSIGVTGGTGSPCDKYTQIYSQCLSSNTSYAEKIRINFCSQVMGSTGNNILTSTGVQLTGSFYLTVRVSLDSNCNMYISCLDSVLQETITGTYLFGTNGPLSGYDTSSQAVINQFIAQLSTNPLVTNSGTNLAIGINPGTITTINPSVDTSFAPYTTLTLYTSWLVDVDVSQVSCPKYCPSVVNQLVDNSGSGCSLGCNVSY